MEKRFEMFPWERAHARIGDNLILVEGNPAIPCSPEVGAAWLDENEQLRKAFIKHARMSGHSGQWRREWKAQDPVAYDAWVRESRARAREKGEPSP